MPGISAVHDASLVPRGVEYWAKKDKRGGPCAHVPQEVHRQPPAAAPQRHEACRTTASNKSNATIIHEMRDEIFALQNST
jgi:hypothetical protein